MKIDTVRLICSFFPPILAQRLRTQLLKQVKNDQGFNFKRESFVGGMLNGNTADFHALRYFIHGYFEWRIIVLVYKILKFKSGDIIEVGANVGTETVSLSALNSDTNVHAFEPLEENFKYLRKIRETNNFENLKLYKTLVSDKKGKAYFKVPDKDNSGSGYILKNPSQESQEIPVVTLDEELKIFSCSVIIMDVEGFEYNVLLGSENIIKKYKPYLILEVNSKFLKERAGITIDFFFKYLFNLGYTPFKIDRMSLIEVNLKTYNAKGGKNWICIPKEDISKASGLSKSIYYNSINPFLGYNIL